MLFSGVNSNGISVTCAKLHHNELVWIVNCPPSNVDSKVHFRIQSLILSFNKIVFCRDSLMKLFEHISRFREETNHNNYLECFEPISGDDGGVSKLRTFLPNFLGSSVEEGGVGRFGTFKSRYSSKHREFKSRYSSKHREFKSRYSSKHSNPDTHLNTENSNKVLV